MNPDTKKEVLLQSFELFKDDYDENSITLGDIIKKMFAIDARIATDMWVFLLQNNIDHIQDPDKAQHLVDRVVFWASQTIGKKAISEIVTGNTFLKNIVFSLSSFGMDCGNSSAIIIANYVRFNNPEVAHELLGLQYTNTNRDCTFGVYLYEVVTEIIDEEIRVNKQSSDLLMYWIDKVNAPKEKARINIAFLDLLTSEDEDE